MKTVSAAVGLLGVFGLVMACSSSAQEPTATPAAGQADLVDRTSPEEASQRIARAACAREEACQNIGLTASFSSLDHCHQVKLDEMRRELSADADCKNGVSPEDVQECIGELGGKACGGVAGIVSDVQGTISMECGSSQLCLD